MPTNSINHRWSIDAGAQRVECQDGHAEIIGAGLPAGNCSHRVKTGTGSSGTFAPCNKTRKVVAIGPYVYDPSNNSMKSTVQGILTWP